MAWEVWLAYAVACVVIAVSPGSGAVLSMSHGLAYGVQRTTPTILGLQIGLVIVLLIAGVGVGAVLVATAEAGEAITASSGLPSVRQRLVIGTMTNLTNPKGIVFMVAVLPQFIDPNRPLALQLLILALTMSVVDIAVMHGYAFLASRAQRWLASARARRAQNRVFGGVLMAMGASLLLVKRAA